VFSKEGFCRWRFDGRIYVLALPIQCSPSHCPFLLNGIENAPASAFPVACCGVSERTTIKWIHSLHFEDSLQLAAGSFNAALHFSCLRVIYLQTSGIIPNLYVQFATETRAPFPAMFIGVHKVRNYIDPFHGELMGAFTLSKNQTRIDSVGNQCAHPQVDYWLHWIPAQLELASRIVIQESTLVDLSAECVAIFGWPSSRSVGYVPLIHQSARRWS
jgi:hypothetical protein